MNQCLATVPASPTIKYGFEKVGLLPSERSSLLDAERDLENHRGARVAEALKVQGGGLKSIGAPYNLNTKLSDTGVLRVNGIAKEMMGDQWSPEANVIADALKHAIISHQNSHDNRDVLRNDTTSSLQLQMEKDAEPSRSSSPISENGKNLRHGTKVRS
jgi:hypothetical protein